MADGTVITDQNPGFSLVEAFHRLMADFIVRIYSGFSIVNTCYAYSGGVCMSVWCKDGACLHGYIYLLDIYLINRASRMLWRGSKGHNI